MRRSGATRLELHHSTLSRLADLGALEYDERTGAVRYRGDLELEALLETVRCVAGERIDS